jgi:hypothetical protein
MAKLMYRCPRTGVNVDIWLADEVTPVSADKAPMRRHELQRIGVAVAEKKVG